MEEQMNKLELTAPIAVTVKNTTRKPIEFHLFAPKYNTTIPAGLIIEGGTKEVSYDFIQNELLSKTLFIGETKLMFYKENRQSENEDDYLATNVHTGIASSLVLLEKDIQGASSQRPESLMQHANPLDNQTGSLVIRKNIKITGNTQLSSFIPAFSKIDFLFYPSPVFEFFEYVKSINHPFVNYLLEVMEIAVNNFAIANRQKKTYDTIAYTKSEKIAFDETTSFAYKFNEIKNSIESSSVTIHKDMLDMFCLCQKYISRNSEVIYSLKTASERHFESIYNTEKNTIASLIAKSSEHLAETKTTYYRLSETERENNKLREEYYKLLKKPQQYEERIEQCKNIIKYYEKKGQTSDVFCEQLRIELNALSKLLIESKLLYSEKIETPPAIVVKKVSSKRKGTVVKNKKAAKTKKAKTGSKKSVLKGDSAKSNVKF